MGLSNCVNSFLMVECMDFMQNMVLQGLCELLLSQIWFSSQIAFCWFVLSRLLLRHLGFDSDFVQISEQKTGGWGLWIGASRHHNSNDSNSTSLVALGWRPFVQGGKGAGKFSRREGLLSTSFSGDFTSLSPIWMSGLDCKMAKITEWAQFTGV